MQTESYRIKDRRQRIIKSLNIGRKEMYFMSRFKRYFLTVLLLMCLPIIGWANDEQEVTAAIDYPRLEKRIADLSVTNMEGKEVAFESIWKRNRVVLVFIRHFG